MSILMKIPQKKDDESLSQYSGNLARLFNSLNSKNSKKNKGQFFTSVEIARYMASLVTAKKSKISVLDPGAGIGILSFAVIEQLVENNRNLEELSLILYENDVEVIPYLKKALEIAKDELKNRKIKFVYEIIEKDFISSNSNALNNNLSEYCESKKNSFDIIISNPPYFKLNKKDVNAKFRDIISGQPNIYFLFMAISAKLLNANGEMIYITPRSFCSGLYYSKFRSWLIDKVSFTHIHLFESRKDLFSSENVLQENIITKFTRVKQDTITISKTTDGNLSNIQSIQVMKKDVIYKSNGHIFFRIPSDDNELNVIKTLDKLPYNFYKLGIKISTGKVVAFRNKEYLDNNVGENSVPLIWMHNIKNGKIQWPINKKNKPLAIKKNATTKKLLLEAKNYIVLKRFTTKEQKKRFDIALIYQKDFEKYKYFALDNMVNYIHNPGQPLNKNQIKGIAKYLNMPIVELYFRILNGHTQVNANEVYALPFPSLAELELFGSSINCTNNIPVLMNQ
ncbi:MAG: N-6 DNA methylase [archaeon]